VRGWLADSESGPRWFSAFGCCHSLINAFFEGNAPTVNGGGGSADTTVFSGESGMVYYLPGTTGWASTFGGWPTAPLHQPNPLILSNNYGLGVSGNQFNFTVCWGTNTSVVVEACTNLANRTPFPFAVSRA